MTLKISFRSIVLPLLAATLPLQAEEDRPRPESTERRPEVRREEPKRPEPPREAPAPERREAAPPRREEPRRPEGRNAPAPGGEAPRRPEGHGPAEARHGAGHPEGRPLPSPEDRHRHLLEASEHLALAGFPEESHRLREQAERLRHAAGEGRGSGHSGAEHAEAAHRALRELNARVDELSREVARLREAVNHSRR
ncbi:MAG: hypothetical protein KGR69_06480 [Verrucomicrobia bacterium]|nr:hypothetical protein [Verrucomicrobiota bacterium]